MGQRSHLLLFQRDCSQVHFGVGLAGCSHQLQPSLRKSHSSYSPVHRITTIIYYPNTFILIAQASDQNVVILAFCLADTAFVPSLDHVLDL